MKMTREYEMEQLALAIVYFEQRLQNCLGRAEALVLEDKIKDLSLQYKELSRG